LKGRRRRTPSSQKCYGIFIYLFFLFLFAVAFAAVLVPFFGVASQREAPQVPAAPAAVAVPPLIQQLIPCEVQREPKECIKCGIFTIKHSSSFSRHQKLCRGPGAPKVFPCGTCGLSFRTKLRKLDHIVKIHE
jgi:hypothetical protein